MAAAASMLGLSARAEIPEDARFEDGDQPSGRLSGSELSSVFNLLDMMDPRPLRPLQKGRPALYRKNTVGKKAQAMHDAAFRPAQYPRPLTRQIRRRMMIVSQKAEFNGRIRTF